METKEQKEQSEEQEEWKELEEKLGISFSEEKSEEEIKTVRITKGIWRRLNEKRGHNGCRTFEDVIEHLLNSENKDI
jgi:hypothetical protein